MSMKNNIKEILNSFKRTTDEVFTLEQLKTRLNDPRPMIIKYGVDVTAPQLHIGHAVNLWMMRKLQEYGHKVIFLIGDFTTRIGDPTGESQLRPLVKQEEIEKNAKEFIEQVSMVLLTDPAVFEVRRNSEWMDSMPTGKFVSLLSMITHSRLISRDMFQRRIQAGSEIYMHEMIYPIIQGYDSVALKSDITIIGTDQLFNEMMGRFYQEKFGQSPQIIITTKITPGIDGKEKQRKSLDNYIGLGHSPRDKFGRAMRIPDRLLMEYFEVYTDLDEAQIKEIGESISTNPMECKYRLAEAIVERYHGKKIAQEERNWFVRTFSQKKVPKDIPTVSIKNSNCTVFDLLRQCYDPFKKSNSELRRLIQQGAVSIDRDKKCDPNGDVSIGNQAILKVGKRTWFRVVLQTKE